METVAQNSESDNMKQSENTNADNWLHGRI